MSANNAKNANITPAESEQEWVAMEGGVLRFYTDVYLDSDKGADVIKLTCQEQGDNTDRPFPISEMETALGDYFSFTFLKSTTGQPGY